MFKYLYKSIICILMSCYILLVNADFDSLNDEKQVLVGNWTLQSNSGSYAMETSYYPNGIAKFVVFSKSLSHQVLGHAVASWHLDNDCILHTTFIDQSNTDLKLVTGIEELEKAVLIDNNHIRLFSTNTEEVKDLHRIKNSTSITSENQ